MFDQNFHRKMDSWQVYVRYSYNPLLNDLHQVERCVTIVTLDRWNATMNGNLHFSFRKFHPVNTFY